jgi:Ca2+-binding RTX toxin-like protein
MWNDRFGRTTLRLESLEGRDVPSTIAYDPSTMTLTIVGTDPDPVSGHTGCDAIKVDVQGKNLVVTCFSDGDAALTTQTFVSKEVKSIQIYGLGGNDQIDCSGTRTQAVYIDGGDGSDAIYGGGGNATLIGGAGDDLIQGGTGNDTINGGDGNDTLIAGRGTNVLTGGAGADSFKVGSKDTITDFSAAEGDALAP